MQFTSPQFFKPCLTDVFVRYVGPHANLYDHKIAKVVVTKWGREVFTFLEQNVGYIRNTQNQLKSYY